MAIIVYIILHIQNLPEAFIENAEKTNANRRCTGQPGQNDYAYSTKGIH
jgi:hypothetical protein